MRFASLLLLTCCAELTFAEPPSPLTALTFAPDGKSVVAASQSGIAMYAWPELKLLQRMKLPFSHLHDLAFSSEGTRLAIAGGNPQEKGGVDIVTWPGLQEVQRLEAGPDVVYCVAWGTNGKSLALACADKTVRLHELASGKTREITDHSAAVLAVLFAPVLGDGEQRELLLSAGRDQSIRVFDASGARPLHTLDNHTAAVNDLALCPANGGNLPLVASAGQDKTVRFWQPTIGRMVRFGRIPSPALAVRWLPGGEYVAIGSADGTLRIMDWQTLKVVQETKVAEGWLAALAVSPDGSRAVVGDERGELHPVKLDGIKRE